VSKIVVFGAGGTAGRLITDEATRRGHTVTAVVRDRSDDRRTGSGSTPVFRK